jgi:hypothetical protein
MLFPPSLMRLPDAATCGNTVLVYGSNDTAVSESEHISQGCVFQVLQPFPDAALPHYLHTVAVGIRPGGGNTPTTAGTFRMQPLPPQMPHRHTFTTIIGRSYVLGCAVFAQQLLTLRKQL